jgi:hypothetical protein
MTDLQQATEKAREDAAQRLSRSYDVLGKDAAQANVEGFLDAQVEALLTPDPQRRIRWIARQPKKSTGISTR